MKLFDRRTFLLGGVATVGALVSPLSARGGSGRRKLLVYFNKGGWDPTFVFDPHFGTTRIEGDPDSTAASAGGIDFADAETRPAVRDFFGAYGHQCAVINGIGVNSISHSQCTRLIMTGTRSSAGYDLPSILASQLGAELPMPYLVVSGPRYPGGYGQFLVPLSHTLTATMRGELPDEVAYSSTHEALIREYLDGESLRLSSGKPDGLFDQYRESLQRQSLLDEDTFKMSDAPTFEENLSSVLAALTMDTSTAVMLEGDLPPLVLWDSHSNNQFAQETAFEYTFQRLSAVMAELESTNGTDGRPLIEQTTVLVISEMGRTPVLNSQLGKDHWPCTSAMVLGAGVAGGQVVGATDDSLNGALVDLTTGGQNPSGVVLDISNVLAGILGAFDVDPEIGFPGVAPFTAPFT